MGDECHSTQLIDADGVFNVDGLDRFLKAIRLADCGLSYAVVSIMGPQSSGKSTLLNHLFGTNFREMDALRGRSQTTKGIWIAKAVGIEPCTIVMDLEGTDGRERGEDDTTFEKQSALFALAISDILLINMWCHDIGREQAANKPLLKTVFQVMMRLFSPRKTTLLFVIRDKTKTPLEYLESVLREDIQKIWDSIPKPHIHKDTALSEFFNVEVTALPSFEEKEELFKQQVAQLRKRFVHSIASGGLAGDRRGVIPASGFLYSAQQIWKVVQENKELDLPAHKIMVATVRCEEISNEKLRRLASDKNWLQLEETVRSGPVLGFGKKLDSILDTYLSEYDAETIYFDDGVRAAKRKQLEARALDLVHPAFQAMLGYLHSKSLEKFQHDLEQSLKHSSGFAASVRNCTQASLLEFNTGFEDVKIKYADWDASKVGEKLLHDIDVHVQSVRQAKLSLLEANYEKQIKEALAEPVGLLFNAAGPDTWASIRRLYNCEMEKALSGFSSSLSGFELDQTTHGKMLERLKNYVRGIVEKKAREEAAKVLMHMKDRFSTVLSHDNDSMPRVWTGRENLRLIIKDAHAAAVKLLSVLAAIRLDDKPDKIEHILTTTLINKLLSQNRSIDTSPDPLASSTWEEVLPENTLITPMQCKSIWRRYKTETEFIVAQAIAAQEAHRRNNSRLPPLWAILAIAVLGFNELMMLLRNPLYLFGLLVLYLLSRALWVQLNITGQFQNGMISGIFALSARFLPAVMNILRKLAEEFQTKYHGTRPPLPPHTITAQSSRSQSLMQLPDFDFGSDSCTSSLSTFSSDTGVEYSSYPAKSQDREENSESSAS